MRFRLLFKRLQTADDLDIKPAREQSLKPVCIGSRGFRLILCEQSGQSALAACRQCYQTVSATFQHVEYNMRLFLNRAIKMSHGHQRTKIVIALCIRSEEHTSELQSLMRISYAVFCFKKTKKQTKQQSYN